MDKVHEIEEVEKKLYKDLIKEALMYWKNWALMFGMLILGAWVAFYLMKSHESNLLEDQTEERVRPLHEKDKKDGR